MLAGLVRVPELEIDKDDAKRIAEAWGAVQKEYSFAALDPKTTAWTNLIFVAGSIYAPRVMTYKLRRAMETENSPAPEQPRPAAPAPAPNARRANAVIIGGVDLNTLDPFKRTQ